MTKKIKRKKPIPLSDKVNRLEKEIIELRVELYESQRFISNHARETSEKVSDLNRRITDMKDMKWMKLIPNLHKFWYGV
jgi:hypothetical protein